jgi:hypothetical protein
MMKDENLPPPPAPTIARQEPSRRTIALVVIVASVLSIIAFAYFYNNGMTNVYGDGIARLNIARKVVDHPDDSLWQRYIQIGTPWLPLQTVLMLPFVASDRMWRTGIAGSIFSMLFYVIGAVSVFLLAASLYRKEAAPYGGALPLIAASIFLLNPSALYMQATPMTELVFMGTLSAAVYMLQRWVARPMRGRLALAAIVMTLATLARYEAWPVAMMAALMVAILFKGGRAERLKNTALFSILVAVGPGYWLWHNWAVYGNAFEFLTGPYSARGRYLETRASLGWANIFVGSAALDVFLMGLTAAVCVGPVVLGLAGAGLARLALTRRRSFLDNAPALLLFVPFFFHVLSLYRGEIQIFPLSAFGLLNVRYGLPHLLAAAVFAPACVPLFERAGKKGALAIVGLGIAFQYGLMLWDGPSQLAVFQEGYRNGVNARPSRERSRVASALRESPPRPMILMHTGALGPVVTKGGLRFSDIIHEGTIRWHQIGDSIPPDVSTVIIQEGDPLERRLGESPALGRDLASGFRVRMDAGKIKVLERGGGDQGHSILERD